MGFLYCALAHMFGLMYPVAAQAQPRLVTIAAGGVNGIYYSVAGSICRQLNKDRAANTRCAVEVSEGSVSNVTLLRRGVAPFALLQADVHYNAYNGSGTFAGAGAQKDMRSVFSLYPEVLTIVASKDVAARQLGEMKGMRLSRGLPGSGGRATMDSLLAAVGWSAADFAPAQERPVEEQGYALCEKKLDGFAYLVGHPAPNVMRTTKSCDARVLSLAEEQIKQFIAGKPYFERTEIAANTYPGQTAPVASVGSLATLMVLESASEDQVYGLVRAVFENLEALKQSNPVLAGLQPARMVKNGLSAPLHPGALRYYREKGWL
ncbi:MAG: TAXI family TRAP transporter solute-binding subunit [Rhodoferax sp.]|nr:TAXI family TRAP transporter solute-binding subunit [Rhodoferax sp.]